MNIIISSLNAAPKTSETTAASLHNTKVYIAETLVEVLANETLMLSSADQTYPCSLVADSSLDKDSLQLKGYTLRSLEGCIPAGTYTCTIASVPSIEITFTEGLVDEHAPIYIRDRSIAPITTSIVAGDRYSQQFVFYIQRCYDGVSFLDDSKLVCVDYIPLDESLLIDKDGNKISYLTTVAKVEDVNPEPDENGRDWIKLIWNVPSAAMAQAGVIKFAISVLGIVTRNNTETLYIWQTSPASFTVLPSLGPRPGVPVSATEELGVLDVLQQQINDLELDVRALESMDYDGDPDNGEYVLGGGGLESWMTAVKQGGFES